jgi:hypothetical protein
MKRWSYASAASSHHGTMRCNCCGKAVEGEYRYREGRSGYVVERRVCSAGDAEWARRDAQVEAARIRTKEQLEAYKAFRDKWDEDALDEAIAFLEKHLRYLG